MKKIIGVVPAASLGDMTKSNMSDHYRILNNYVKRAAEAGCVPIGMAPVDYWLS
jgi:LDH2 family malate/lactate/ureidoglycolate dehydrogenase